MISYHSRERSRRPRARVRVRLAVQGRRHLAAGDHPAGAVAWSWHSEDHVAVAETVAQQDRSGHPANSGVSHAGARPAARQLGRHRPRHRRSDRVRATSGRGLQDSPGSRPCRGREGAVEARRESTHRSGDRRPRDRGRSLRRPPPTTRRAAARERQHHAVRQPNRSIPAPVPEGWNTTSMWRRGPRSLGGRSGEEPTGNRPLGWAAPDGNLTARPWSAGAASTNCCRSFFPAHAARPAMVIRLPAAATNYRVVKLPSDALDESMLRATAGNP